MSSVLTCKTASRAVLFIEKIIVYRHRPSPIKTVVSLMNQIMSQERFMDVVEISDDEDEPVQKEKKIKSKAKSTKVDETTAPNSQEPSSSTNKQTELNKKLKITVKQNQNNQNSTKVVIEIDDLPSSQEFVKQDSYKCFLEEFKDESFTLEFLQLIELCLKYECSDGMTRILKKNLVPKFKMANRAFIESLQFQEILEKIIRFMQREPNLKFSCIKTVCEVLKENEAKKRVNFVTLDKNVSVKRKTEFHTKKQSKKQIIDTIDLDNFQSTRVIDVDAIQDDIEDVEIINDVKENCAANKEPNKENNEPPKTIKESQSQVVEQEDIISSLSVPLSPKSIERNQKIRDNEALIKQLKSKIKYYDEMEVTNDCIGSPYIINHGLQTKLLDCYKRLCQLRGESPMRRKCKEIILSASEGQPPGPTRVLQNFMNQRIQEAEGEDPPFPDFVDVVKCVSQANVDDELGWSKAQILASAQLLFRQIGTALQERRKKREWRDMCRFVLDEDRDPADEDPELQARLEVNRMMALKKESDVLDYYTKMEATTKVNKKITILASQRDAALAEISKETPATNQEPNNDFFLGFEVPLLEVEPQSEDSDQSELDIKPTIVPNPIDPNIEIEISDSEDYSSSDDEVSDFELDDVVTESSSSRVEESLNETLKQTETIEYGNVNDLHTNAIKSEKPSENIEPTITSENPTVDREEIAKEVAVKTDPDSPKRTQTEQEDDTLKFLLDVNSCKEITIKTSVFDIEEPVVFIEISSSSESECESESEDFCEKEDLS